MKVKVLRVKAFEAASAEELTAAIEAWCRAAGERKYLGLEYQAPAPDRHTALLKYTE